MPVHTAALPSHRLQDFLLPPAPGNGDMPFPAGRAWRAGTGAGAGAELCPLSTPGAAPPVLRWHSPTAAALEGRGEPQQGLLSFPVELQLLQIAPNGNTKGHNKAQEVKICPRRAL